MNPSIVSSISRLANYMPLGSYVIYTALETYSFSLGTTPSPITTIIQTPAYNYTCLYIPGGNLTYTSCTTDQSNALCISLSIGFFLAVFLSFLKHVPVGGSPPLAPEDGDNEDEHVGMVDEETQTVQQQVQVQRSKELQGTNGKKIKYRSGVVYAQGNYYLDFGDYHVWGHAALSFVAFGTLSLFSSSVSQCLFPKVKPWIFVFTQIILLVICAFIAMFWIDDPSLSIGLMVVPPTENHSTQTSNDSVVSRVSTVGLNLGGGAGGAMLGPGQFAAAPTSNVATSTSAFPTMNLAHFSSSGGTNLNKVQQGSSSSVLMNAPMNISSSSVFSASTAVNGSNNNSNNNSTTATGAGTGTNRLGVLSKRVSTMSSVNEKQDEVHELSDRHTTAIGPGTNTTGASIAQSGNSGRAAGQEWNGRDGGSPSALVQGILIASSLDSPSPSPGSSSPSPSSDLSSDHVSVKMD
ncbi:hypothetical protein BGX23_007558 [Mortierella sp. AD031]|nr:hypothetical protein BGX23_007558 [Mortierella sp. AD031]